MKNKTLVITGGTSGLGRATVLTLLEQDWTIYLLARNERRARALQKRKKGEQLHYVPCDLAEMESVRKAARTLLKEDIRIDVLMNNAGGIFQQQEWTKDGFEMTLGVNHLSHFLLTNLLLKKLIADRSRIINVSSAGHKGGKLNFSDLEFRSRKYSSFRAYCNAKLCNIYFTVELHKRYHDQEIKCPGCVSGKICIHNTRM
jgi:NAD(P)-dependent dehydrogenase (short-subunit alcohol dehydrogenase family)